MRQREPRRSGRVDEVPEDHRTAVMSGFLASTHTVRLSHQMLMMASLLSPGQASFGKLWEYLVATFTLRLAATAAATAGHDELLLATAALPRNARSLSLSISLTRDGKRKVEEAQ